MWLAEDRIFSTNETHAPYCMVSAYSVKQGLVNLEKVLREKRKKLKLEQNSPHPDQKLIDRLNVIISCLENTLSKKAALDNNTTAHVR